MWDQHLLWLLVQCIQLTQFRILQIEIICNWNAICQVIKLRFYICSMFYISMTWTFITLTQHIIIWIDPNFDYTSLPHLPLVSGVICIYLYSQKRRWNMRWNWLSMVPVVTLAGENEKLYHFSHGIWLVFATLFWFMCMIYLNIYYHYTRVIFSQNAALPVDGTSVFCRWTGGQIFTDNVACIAIKLIGPNDILHNHIRPG